MTPTRGSRTTPRGDLRHGIRSRAGVVDPHDSGRDLRRADGKDDREDNDRDGGPNSEDLDDDDHPGAGNSGLAIGEYATLRTTRIML